MAHQWAFAVGTACIVAATFAWASNSYIVFRKCKTCLIQFKFISNIKNNVYFNVHFSFWIYFLFDLLFQSISAASPHMFWLQNIFELPFRALYSILGSLYCAKCDPQMSMNPEAKHLKWLAQWEAAHKTLPHNQTHTYTHMLAGILSQISWIKSFLNAKQHSLLFCCPCC